MRISTKTTGALGAGALLVFGISGVIQYQHERQDLIASTERELKMLGTAVQVAIENALRDKQLEDVQETLESLEKLDPQVDLVVLDASQRVVAHSGRSAAYEATHAAMLATAIAEDRMVLRFYPAEEPLVAILGLPLNGPTAGERGAILLLKPLTEMRRDLAETRASLARSALLLLSLITGLGFFLGVSYVSRPLGRLLGAMDRLRRGDLSTKLPVGAHDEAGELALEFNRTVTELAQARARVTEEAAKRRSLEQGLLRVDKLITIGQLSSGLAHEIGSPLQILNGRARALLSCSHHPEETARIAEILVRQSDRIARIVEQLLHFSRRGAPRLDRLDLAAQVINVVELLELLARRKQVRLELKVARPLPQVLADGDQVQQLALNLLSNALEATAPGGRITVTLEEPLDSELPGARSIRLVVEDTGNGIADEHMARLFEPFFTTRSTTGGTGLGLAVVKAIVSEHGGRIGARSSAGEGTRFTVDLPVDGPGWQQLQQARG